MTTRSIPDDPLLSVEDLGVRFGGIVALDSVSFAVERGIVCGLIGPNGAGKTTLFNCLSRLYEFDAGRIRFDGVDLGALPRHRIAALGIGRTFQNLALFGTMSVLDNVLVGTHSRTRSGFLANALRLPGVAAEERAARDRAAQRLELLGLDAVMHVPVAELPFGTCKRVELARALAAEPRLLLLDEPNEGLAPVIVQQIGTLIDRLAGTTTILFTDQRARFALRHAQRGYILQKGRIVYEGSAQGIADDPQAQRHLAVA